MMRFPLHSASPRESVYESTVTFEATSLPGVRFTVVRMSFGRRTELFRKIREIAVRAPFLEASSDFGERIEASLLSQEIENLYLRWGLVGVEGLLIDGQAPGTEVLLNRGPESLCSEIVTAIKKQCGLQEEERKN